MVWPWAMRTVTAWTTSTFAIPKVCRIDFISATLTARFETCLPVRVRIGWKTPTRPLLVDLDNDADQDLLITADFQLVILRNDGTGRFSEAFHTSGPATFISAAAADYDSDGDLDLFVCGYGRTRVPGRSTDELSQPTPYHDARNGGPNLLLRNDGELKFSNATVESGLGKEEFPLQFCRLLGGL